MRPPRSCFALVVVTSCAACDGPDSGGGARAGAPPDGAVTTSSASSSSGATTSSTGWEGWTPLAAVPEHCNIFVADSPASMGPLKWVPCSGGTPGCRDLQVTWAPPGTQYVFRDDFAGAAPAAQSPRISMPWRLTGALEGWSDVVMANVDGTVIAAIRGRDSTQTSQICYAARPSVGVDRIVGMIFDVTTYPPPAEYEWQVLLPGGKPSVFNTLSAEAVHGNGGNSRSIGESFVATGFTPGNFILNVPYDGSAPTLVAKFDATDPLPFNPSRPIVVGSDVLYWATSSDRAREQIYHVDTGATETLLDVPGYDVFGVATDGKTIVWIQQAPPSSVSETPTTFELWSSTFATSAAGLVPKKLADLAPGLASPYTRLESDMFAIWGAVGLGDDVSWSHDLIYRLSDDTYWTVDAPSGSWFGEVLYLAPDEIAFPLQPPWKHTETYTIRRQPLADLGSPQPVTGPIQ